MKFEFWEKRERVAEIIFTAMLFITVIITFIENHIKINEKILFISMGLLESTLLVLLFSRAMNLLNQSKTKEKINPFKFIAFIVYCGMFAVIGYYFVMLRVVI